MFQTAALKQYQKGLICSAENNYHKPVLFFFFWDHFMTKNCKCQRLIKKEHGGTDHPTAHFCTDLVKGLSWNFTGRMPWANLQDSENHRSKAPHELSLPALPWESSTRNTDDAPSPLNLLSMMSNAQLFPFHPGLPPFCFSSQHFRASSHHSCGD